MRVCFLRRRLRGEVADYHLACLENISTRGAEAVAFDDSITDGFGLADADEVFFAAGAGEMGATDVGAHEAVG